MNKISFKKEGAVKIEVLAVKQPIGTFYVGVVRANDAVAICSAKERKKDEQDELERYIGMQRPLNPQRVKEIKKYVKTWDASFPNSVIIAVNPGYYFFEKENNIMYIKRDKNSANIIDGQHRLAGFDEKNGEGFYIILAIFPELELEEQAYLFSVINTKMTRINPSLARDLYAFATINTPEKLTHNIAKTFNQDVNNPWYQKIKMLGKKERRADPILSQSAFTKEIIGLICDKEDSYEIRDILKRNKNDRTSLKNFYNKTEAKKFILWEPFINGEDKFIYTVLKDYFLAIFEVYKNDWNNPSKILIKTTGYIALMKIFRILYTKGFKEGNLTKNFFKSNFERAKESGKVKEFISTNYNPGGMGERNLAQDLLKGMKLNHE